MKRREFHFAALASVIVLAQQQAWALSLEDLGNLSELEASTGLKGALKQNALSAIGILGKKDGFLANPRVRIPLPGYLDDTAKLLSKFGQRKRINALVTGMNRAAEKAVPYANDLLVNAVENMTVVDAKNILTGGDRSITEFFAKKTREPLTVEFLPIVTNATKEVELAKKFNKLADKAKRFGLVNQKESSIEQYVTAKTLTGLYTIIGDQEVALRQDPGKAGSEIIRKVFGNL